VIINNNLNVLVGFYLYSPRVISRISLRESGRQGGGRGEGEGREGREERGGRGACVQVVYLWIHVNHFSITFVLKQQSSLVICNHLKVRCGVGGGGLGLPVVKAEIRGAREEAFLALEVGLEILGFEAVCVVDVSADFLAFVVFISYENDGLTNE
jgi:hypothetical protein